MRAAPFGLHQTGSHRRVVEHAKTAAFVGISVVRAPRQIGGHALPLKQRGSGRHDGRAC